MLSQLVTWEDDETNRQIQFSVEFGLENSNVQIQSVTPTKIVFVCPETNSCVRTMGVHTATGRRVLADRLHKAGRLGAIQAELEARHLRPMIV